MLQWVIKMNEIINIKDYLKENFDKKTEIIEIKNKNIPIYLSIKNLDASEKIVYKNSYQNTMIYLRNLV